MTLSVTSCLGHHCRTRILPPRVFCTGCWQKVPKNLQDRVASTWTPGAPSEEHRRAVADAVRYLTLPLD